MSDDSWRDRIVGERMTVDQEFASRIEQSRFSSQEWSLIMTATEFEIEKPETPESARLVVDTDNIESILPELENIRTQMGAMGGAPAEQNSARSGGGILESIKNAVGFGSDGTSGGADEYDDEREAAERLTQEYAETLQNHLESAGRWETVCEAAAES